MRTDKQINLGEIFIILGLDAKFCKSTLCLCISTQICNNNLTGEVNALCPFINRDMTRVRRKNYDDPFPTLTLNIVQSALCLTRRAGEQTEPDAATTTNLQTLAKPHGNVLSRKHLQTVGFNISYNLVGPFHSNWTGNWSQWTR